MNVQLLIDALVRQTMVLIAQVATTAGTRAPLAHVANQVFINLVGELESQGVGRKVVADMFGLALRSYQQKVQRLKESATLAGLTTWEAVLRHITEKQVVARPQILTRFSRDDTAVVKSILRDLVDSGLVYQAGKGDAAIYRAAPAEDLAQVGDELERHNVEAMVWVTVYRNGPLNFASLSKLVPVDKARLSDVLQNLIEEGRITAEQSEGEPTYSSKHCLIELGSDAGWEAALIDHHQAIVAAICAKLRNGATKAHPADRLGGSTFSFDVWPGHPLEDRVYNLLSDFRQSLSQLWDDVHRHNETHDPEDESKVRVTFYLGQSVTTNSEEGLPR